MATTDNHLRDITFSAIKSFYEGFDDIILDEEKELRWFSHWFKTAEIFCDNLEKEGLTDAVSSVKKVIADQKDIVHRLTN